jgi:hypothetical protein
MKRQTLKVKGRRQAERVGDEVALVEGVLAVELVDLDSDTVVLLEATGLAEGSFADGGDGLGDCVGNASEDGVCDHHGHDWGVVRISCEGDWRMTYAVAHHSTS